MQPSDRELEAAAEALLLALHDDGHVQLVNRATAHALAEPLSRFLLRIDPATSWLADWLVEQKGVAEVFASDDVLGDYLERIRARLRPASAAGPTHAFELEGSTWVRAFDVDLGFGPTEVRIELEHEPDPAVLARVARIEQLLPGSWQRWWWPALARYDQAALFRDAAATAAAFSGLTAYVESDRWSVQLTFAARGLETTGFFVDMDDDRVIASYTVD